MMKFRKGEVLLFNDDGVIRRRTIMGVKGSDYICYYHDLKETLYTTIEFADKHYYRTFNSYYEEISKNS